MVNKFLIAAAALALMTSEAQAQEMDFAAVDTNRDGAVTMQEAQAARAAMFDRLDADGNGSVTEAEREAAAQQAASRGGDRFERADVNNDGVVSEAEFMNQPYRAFDYLDRNRDGVLSADETSGLRARMARR